MDVQAREKPPIRIINTPIPRDKPPSPKKTLVPEVILQTGTPVKTDERGICRHSNKNTER